MGPPLKAIFYLTVCACFTQGKLEVRACEDAHLLLMQNKTDVDDHLYDIVLGGWGNTKSAILKSRSGNVTTCNYIIHKLLGCNRLRQFWISWEAGIINIGVGPTINLSVFMVYTDTQPIDIKHVSVSHGYWIVYSSGDECDTEEPRNCKDLNQSGITSSGVYRVASDGVNLALDVYCDMLTDSGGWLVFQRRQDGSEEFNRGWDDYESGFGDLFGEFWLGNRYLSRLVSQGRHELRIDLEDWEGNKRYAKYDTFTIGDWLDKYKLTIGGYSGDAVLESFQMKTVRYCVETTKLAKDLTFQRHIVNRNVQAAAGDAMTYANGVEFSTLDRDNDERSYQNCVDYFKGAWWYKDCHYANLNGLYLKGNHSGRDHGKSICWHQWLGLFYSLKRTEMKIRMTC